SIRWSYGNHEHRLAESARYAATLSDREARESFVLADDVAVGEHERSAAQRRSVRSQFFANDLGVIPVGDEADVLTLLFLRNDLEPELVRHGARFGLRLRAYGQDHARQHAAIDAPEEIRLILRVIHAAMQRAVDHPGV